MDGQKAPTGPREARPDDRLRAVFTPNDPAISLSGAQRGKLTIAFDKAGRSAWWIVLWRGCEEVITDFHAVTI